MATEPKQLAAVLAAVYETALPIRERLALAGLEAHHLDELQARTGLSDAQVEERLRGRLAARARAEFLLEEHPLFAELPLLAARLAVNICACDEPAAGATDGEVAGLAKIIVSSGAMCFYAEQFAAYEGPIFKSEIN